MSRCSPITEERRNFVLVLFARHNATVTCLVIVTHRRRSQLVTRQRPAPRMILDETRLTIRNLKTKQNYNRSKDKDFLEFINPDSLNVLTEVYVEEALKGVAVGRGLQFLRKGYFCLDPDSTEDRMIFNRTVTLRDNWAKKKG